MARFDTSKGQSVPHCHIAEPSCYPREVTAQEIQDARAWMAVKHPKAVEVNPPSYRYNCHGFAYTGSHGWFDYPELFLLHDFYEVPFNTPRKGDVVLYMNGCVIMHSAIVQTVSGGKIRKVRSKWAAMQAVEHDLKDVEPVYGEPSCLMRRINRQDL